MVGDNLMPWILHEIFDQLKFILYIFYETLDDFPK